MFGMEKTSSVMGFTEKRVGTAQQKREKVGTMGRPLTAAYA